MADGYDRFENEGGSGGGSFVMGLLTGTVLGAGLGMLFAPKAGSELRGQLSEQAGNLANTASEGYRKATESAGQWAQSGKEAANKWADRGKDVYDKAREAVNRGTEEAQRYVRDTAGGMSGTGAPATAPGGSTGSSSSSVYGSGSEHTRGGGNESMSSHAGGTYAGPPSSPGSTGGPRRS
jgi:gas vesicle protein